MGSRFKKFKPGERDHITIVGEDPTRGQILECGVCKAQWPPKTGKIKGRARFAHTHWMVQHVKCRKTKAE